MTVTAGTHLVAVWSYPESWDCTKSSVELVGTCEICGKDDVTKTITIEPTKEHTWGAWVYPEGDFDCLKADKDGKYIKRTHTCTVCNKKVSETPKEHVVAEDAVWKIKEGQLCTTGHNLVTTCSACGKEATKYEAAKDHVLIESTITKPADAQCEKGYTVYGDCSVCGAIRVGLDIEAGKCNVKTWNYPEKGTYSCTGKTNSGKDAPFKMVGTCTVCGQKCETNPTGTEIRGTHDVSVWSVKAGEDCTAAGHIMTGVCNECGYTVERKATAEEVHEKHTIPNPTSISGVIPSDCAQGFSVSGYCTVCKRNETNEVAPGTPHVLGEYKVTKAPTCVMDGEETADCAVCDTSVKRLVKADGKTHKFGIDGQCINTNADGTMQCVANRGAYPTVNNVTVQVDKTTGVDVTWTPSNTSVSYSNFKSTNNAIATVTSSGSIKGIAPGIVNITFDAKFGSETIPLTCMVTVVDSVSINCPSTSTKFASGATVNLTPSLTSAVGNVTWKAVNGNSEVADVTINSATGATVVKAKKEGVAKITLSATFVNNGKEFTSTDDVYVSFYGTTEMTLTVASNVGAFDFSDRGVFSKAVVDGSSLSNVGNRSLASILAGGTAYELQQFETNSTVGKISGGSWVAGTLYRTASLSGLKFTAMANGEFDLSYKVLGEEGITLDQGVMTIVVNSSKCVSYEANKDKVLALEADDFTKFWTDMGYSGKPTSITILTDVSVGGLYTEKGLNTRVKSGNTFYFSGSSSLLDDVVYMPKNQNTDYNDEFTFLMKNGTDELYGTAKIDVSEKLPFTDVKKTDWFYDAVKNAYQNDLIDGVSATQFKPTSNLTVAQAIKLAAALHQMDNDGKVTLVNGTGNTWYSTYVNYAVAEEIIEAKYATYSLAQMNATITRNEFVHIFYGAMDNYKVINTVTANAIPDVKIGSTPNAEEIYTFYRAGILTGSNAQGTFYPNNNIKRSEVAAILIRMYDTAQRETGLTLS